LLSSLASKRESKPSLASLASRGSNSIAQGDRPAGSLSRLAAKAKNGTGNEKQNGASKDVKGSSDAPVPVFQATTRPVVSNPQKPLSKLQQRALQGRNKETQAIAKPRVPEAEPDIQIGESETLPDSSLFSALPAGKTKPSAFANVLAPTSMKESMAAAESQALRASANIAGFQEPSPDDLFAQARAAQSFKMPFLRK
jgi:hypothetical protein